MPLNSKKIYGFPQYPMTEENQTVEQDIKKASLEGVSRAPDTRLMDLLKKRKRKHMAENLGIEIEIEEPNEMEEPEEEMNPREKLEHEISENAMGGHDYPDSYFRKHLVESMSSESPGMMALGLDCLNELIGLLTDEQRALIRNSWEEYFEEDAEFKKLENDDASDRLKTIFKSEFLPLMMGKAKKKFENKEI
jgi:hypothetical protein